MNYLRIYEAIIANRIKSPSTEEYTEKHHIIPKWMGGNDNTENIVRLSLREHFHCHLLLWKHYKSISSALACQALFPAIDLKMEKRIPSGISKVASIFRSSLYSARKGYVYITENRWITSEEYQNNKDKYKVAASGKVTCFDNILGKNVAIDTPLFYENRDRYSVTPKVSSQTYVKAGVSRIFHTNDVPEGWNHWRTGKAPYNKGVPSGMVNAIDLTTGEKCTVTKKEYTEFKNIKYVHVTSVNKVNPPCGFVRVYFIETGLTGSVTKEEYAEFKNIKYVHSSAYKRMKKEGKL